MLIITLKVINYNELILVESKKWYLYVRWLHPYIPIIKIKLEDKFKNISFIQENGLRTPVTTITFTFGLMPLGNM